MNKYLIPICYDDSDISIETIVAKSLSEAKDKLIQKFINDYEYDAPDDWRDFIKYMYEHYVTIGEPQDIETF